MSKITSQKEYAININHPIFGMFYYSYLGYNNWNDPDDVSIAFVFTNNINKVQKWKTNKFTEKHINLILTKIKEDKGNIYLSLGNEVDESIKTKTIISKKKYYYPIPKYNNDKIYIKSKYQIIEAEKNIDILSKSIPEDSKINYDVHHNMIKYYSNINVGIIDDMNNIEYIIKKSEDTTNMIFEHVKNENDFYYKMSKQYKDIIRYKNYMNTIKDYESFNGLYLDIVDASYGFRKLKLKTLSFLQ